MQQFKPLFADPNHVGTIANTQSCLRLGDLEEIGDGTHSLHFEMLGLFSFRQMSVGEAIDFWLEFLERIGAWPDHVTIHPDKMEEWTPLYRGRVPIQADPECVWSDGAISGYCTEFYRAASDGGVPVEIGNIVAPLGTCIDVGFGLERLELVVNGSDPETTETILKTAIRKIIDSGYSPGNRQQGYVLRKLLRRLWTTGGSIDHPFFREEVERQERLQRLYDRVKTKHADKSPEWWFDTYGVTIEA
jgi:alanyl-tRNA synthetase